ncbi:uncharacterized protein LOC111260376 [Varroa jacobsoni]|uniref:uncharacterized protein LOC111260376 n=1 Tax=Varroa jacobsoni TaxID=62625 RepID=UPI000BF4D4F6|nr:uncharacterized protein LOC111260376 [Varroa jacobsoni]
MQQILVTLATGCFWMAATALKLQENSVPTNFVSKHRHMQHMNGIRRPSEIRSLIASLIGPKGGSNGAPFRSVSSRLDYQECLKRSICEAHHDRMKFGVIGLAMQLIFPPFDRNIFGSRIRRPFALAAQYGASRRADCSSQYDGCVISWLKVMQKTVDYIMVKRDNRGSATVHEALRSRGATSERKL